MASRLVQCICGQIVAVPKQSRGVRCPSCGATVSTKISDRGARRSIERQDLSESEKVAEPDEPDGDYGLAGTTTDQPARSSTWVPVRGTGPASGTVRADRLVQAADYLVRPSGQRTQELPGPFFTWSACLYPFLHPNWIRWLGLAFMTGLAALMIGVALFVFSVIMRFGAFVSLFAVPTMATGCLALVSFVFGSFVTVIEETTQGEDRLSRLIDLNWWETLPRMMMVIGAIGSTIGFILLITAPLRIWFPLEPQRLLLLQAIMGFQIFPIFLITNLVDASWIPWRSLLATLSRMAACAGSLAGFLLISGIATALVVPSLIALYGVHPGWAIAGVGPLVAAWLMMYGHWLGRLVRQMSAVG